MSDTPTAIYVQWSDDGQHIRKWSHEPFEGSAAFVPADTITALRAEVARLRGLLDKVGCFLDDFAKADLDEGAADAVTVGMVYQQQAQTVVLPRITLALKDSCDEGDRP